MATLGPDFISAKTRWLYPQQEMQWPWRAAIFFVLLFILNTFLQFAFGAVVYKFVLGHGLDQLFDPDGMVDFAKASIIGLLPASVVVVLLAIYLAKFGIAERAGLLPLRVPQLGFWGWILVIFGFAFVMYAAFIGLFASLGIDPETYSPTGGGLGKDNSSAGLVEKTMADLADEPWLFALAIPGVIIAVPLAEEFIFRGALFAGLVNSPVGKVGAVLITAALWSLAHAGAAPWVVVGVLFIMGLVLGVLLLRFGSLWVTICCHGAWNALSSLALFGAGHHT